MSDQYEEQNTDSSGQDQTEGGAGTGEGGGEENNEADMIFAPEASKPGRNAGMLMIAFVMIGVGVIYFMRARGGPATVIASTEVQKADALIKGFDGTQVRKMEELLKTTEKVVKQWDVDKNATPDKELVSNPFKFVSPTDHGPTTDPNAKDKEQAKAKAQFLEGLDNMKVQYIMVSPFAKTAMINNKLVQEGQEVDGYVIDKISPQEVYFSKTIKSYGFKAAKSTSKELK
jgi:hypothetical protein